MKSNERLCPSWDLPWLLQNFSTTWPLMYVYTTRGPQPLKHMNYLRQGQGGVRQGWKIIFSLFWIRTSVNVRQVPMSLLPSGTTLVKGTWWPHHSHSQEGSLKLATHQNSLESFQKLQIPKGSFQISSINPQELCLFIFLKLPGWQWCTYRVRKDRKAKERSSMSAVAN